MLAALPLLWVSTALLAWYRPAALVLVSKEAGGSCEQEIIIEFQNKVEQTINEVTSHQTRGAMPAAYGQSYLIWKVQTFRNPTTGWTFELSNKFDYAWLNGTNQYVVSDDPNFNPNGSLSGNWTHLQLVQP